MQVGDKVRATALAPTSYNVVPGAEGTLVEMYEGMPFGYSVKWDKIRSQHGSRIWLMSADEIEPLDAR